MRYGKKYGVRALLRVVLRGRAEGRAEGRDESAIEHIKSLMQTTGWAIEKVMEALNIPKVDWEKYKAAVQG